MSVKYILLLWMLFGFSHTGFSAVPAIYVNSDNLTTTQMLKKELKELRRKKHALKAYTIRLRRGNKRIQAALAKCNGYSLKEPSSTFTMDKKSTITSKNDSNDRLKDSRLRWKITKVKTEIAALRKEKYRLDSIHKTVKQQSLKMVATSALHGNGTGNTIQKLNKTVLYESKRNFNLKKRLNSKTDLKEIHQSLEAAKTENTAFSKLITNGRKSLLTKPVQFKKDVYKSIPKSSPSQANAGGGNPLAGYMQGFMSLRSKNRTTNEILDTTGVKLNPHRAKILMERLQPSYNFQYIRSNVLTPAILEHALVFTFLLTGKSKPFLGFTYKMGLGQDIEHTQISYQGMGIRAGAEYQILKPIGAFLSYEHQISSTSNSENIPRGRDRCVVGLLLSYGAQKKLKTYIGYDVVNFFEPGNNRTPLVFRIGFN